MNDEQEYGLGDWEDEGGSVSGDVPEDWEIDDWEDDWDEIDEIDDFEYYQLDKDEE